MKYGFVYFKLLLLIRHKLFEHNSLHEKARLTNSTDL